MLRARDSRSISPPEETFRLSKHQISYDKKFFVDVYNALKDFNKESQTFLPLSRLTEWEELREALLE